MSAAARPVRVVCLAVHPPQLAATRLRLTQYFAHFAQRGISVELWTFLRPGDLKRWYGSSTFHRLVVVGRAIARIPRAIRLIRGADLVIVQRECLPFAGPWLERVAAHWSRLVWDVDDFVWEPYTSPTAGRITRRLRTSARKHAAICRMASEVWAGSAGIVEWAQAHNSEVIEVPTVVDVPAHLPTRAREPKAAWVGSHSTSPFLEQVLHAVDVSKNVASVVAVGADRIDVPLARITLTQQPWTPENERDACESSTVGLYPVDRSHVYAEGKCALKAILYMSHGLPCVVTPTRPNVAVVRHGIDGLHASSDEEWTAAVDQLLSDSELWARCSVEAHQRARDQYSVAVWAPRLADRVTALVKRSHDQARVGD